MDYCCIASCHRDTWTLGSISVAGQIYSDYNFIGIWQDLLRRDISRQHGGFSLVLVLVVAILGILLGFLMKRWVHVLFIWLAFSELNKIVCALCMVAVVQLSGLFIIGSDAYCNFLIHIINFSQTISHSYQHQLLSACKRLEVLRCSILVFERFWLIVGILLHI